MKKLSLLLFLVFFCVRVLAQIINTNPDPDGEPWIIGPGNGLGDSTPSLIFSPDALAESSSSVDNSQLEFFYEIFNQSPSLPGYNSCSQASAVTYTFGYEINRYKGANGQLPENIYSPSYTWDYLNGGNNQGSLVSDGWHIIMDNGCPNLTDWGNFYEDVVWGIIWKCNLGGSTW